VVDARAVTPHPEPSPLDRVLGPPAGASQGGEPVVVVQGLGKEYDLGSAKVHALRNVSLRIHRGDFVVFLGPSGSGKTTLLNIVGGLERPTAGVAWVAGHRLEQMDAKELTAYRRDNVGFIFQFFNLIPTLTAKENVELATRHARQPRAANEVLSAVGLGDRLDHFPGELSGGEQQRVAIARALAKQPPILICDEPTGELDAETGRKVLALLQQVNRRQGITVLLVTHNAAIAKMAHHVVSMRSGTIDHVENNPNPAAAESLRW
jgi:putative ABC transport system ATP-binding protein